MNCFGIDRNRLCSNQNDHDADPGKYGSEEKRPHQGKTAFEASLNDQAGQFFAFIRNVVAIEVHDLLPRGNAVAHALLLVVVTRIDLRKRTELRM